MCWKQLYNPEETRLQYEAYQTPSASSYDTSPTTYETSPTTYETSPTTYETPPTTYETSPTTYETSDPSLNRPTASKPINPHHAADTHPVKLSHGLIMYEIYIWGLSFKAKIELGSLQSRVNGN